MDLPIPDDLAERPAQQRILLTAHELFYRDGIRATGIDRVIAESGVSKMTFYRHFPSKNHLVLACLEYRHNQWMAWFTGALHRHGGGRNSRGSLALVPALNEWFNGSRFHGCAFLNAAVELGATVPGVLDFAREHKQCMTRVIAALLPRSPQPEQDAHLIGIVVDGAIVRVQAGEPAEVVLHDLSRLLALLDPVT